MTTQVLFKNNNFYLRKICTKDRSHVLIFYLSVKITENSLSNVFRRSFRQKVNQLQKKEVFNADGRHTFFIPVEEGFKV